MDSSFGINVDVSAMNLMIDGISEQLADAARPAAQAGSQVLYDEVRRNVSALGRKTGNLDRSIYQVFSASNSGEGVATYHVSWNARKAPHGHLVERGYIQKYQVVMTKSGKWITLKDRPLKTPIQIPAKAFVRRAIDKFPAAYAAAEAELLRRINGGT